MGTLSIILKETVEARRLEEQERQSKEDEELKSHLDEETQKHKYTYVHLKVQIGSLGASQIKTVSNTPAWSHAECMYTYIILYEGIHAWSNGTICVQTKLMCICRKLYKGILGKY